MVYPVARGAVLNNNAWPMERIESIDALPELREDDIHIWGVHVPSVRKRLGALGGFLNETELARAARFHGEGDRETAVASRGALRVLLAGYSGAAPTDIVFRYSENGKPRAVDTGVDFNVSHSGEWIVLAIGKERQIGVDVEEIRRNVDVDSIAARYLTKEESAWIAQAEDPYAVFFQIWARKEAYVKARGSALFRELSSFTVPLEDVEKDGWSFHRLEAGSKYAAAVVADRPASRIPCYDFGGLKWAN